MILNFEMQNQCTVCKTAMGDRETHTHLYKMVTFKTKKNPRLVGGEEVGRLSGIHHARRESLRIVINVNPFVFLFLLLGP